MLARRLLVALAAVLVATPALGQPTFSRWALSDAIDAALDGEDLGPAVWGAHVVDLTSGEVLYSRASYGSFIPASNMKLVTTAAALDAFGPGHRFETALYADGEVAYGTLAGPLILRGAGDPMLVGRRARAELRRVFHGWADSLHARRIRTVLGPVLLADDTVADPDLDLAEILADVFHDEGIQIVEREAAVLAPWQTPAYDSMERLASHRSAPLADYIRLTNEDSNNAYAERLLWATAARVHGGPAPGAFRASAVEESLRHLGVDARSVVVADGSGLSRSNRMTPAGAVELLAAMWDHPSVETRAAFVESLPVGGRTGTLRRRYRAGDARGNVRAKTGYVRGVRTLSGYVTSATGRPLAFSLMCNGYTTRTSRVNRVQDAVVELLADYEGHQIGG